MDRTCQEAVKSLEDCEMVSTACAEDEDELADPMQRPIRATPWVTTSLSEVYQLMTRAGFLQVRGADEPELSQYACF